MPSAVGRRPPAVSRLLFQAVALSVGVAGLYLALPAARYNPDGLRIFPALRSVTLDSTGTPKAMPRSWATAYSEPHYFRANVRMHVLFPAYAAVAGRVFQVVTGRDDLVRALQIANALICALALALFFRLVAGLTGSNWIGLGAGVALPFSSAFCLTATNIAEVAPSLPFLLLGLLILVQGNGGTLPSFPADNGQQTTGDSEMGVASPISLGVIAAGLLFSLSSGFYLLSLVIAGALSVLLLLERDWRRAAVLLLSATLGTLLVYTLVLLAAGHVSLSSLLHALAARQDQGNYGFFRLSNLLSVLLAFPNSLAPVLPDDFGGIRRFIAGLRSGGFSGPAAIIGLALVWALIVLAAIRIVRLLRRAISIGRTAEGRWRLATIGLAVFLAALAVSLIWDPYHPKLWAYSNIAFWLTVAGAATGEIVDAGKSGTVPACGLSPDSPGAASRHSRNRFPGGCADSRLPPW